MSSDATDKTVESTQATSVDHTTEMTADESTPAQRSSPETRKTAENRADERLFEDLTISELLAHWRRSPASTLRRFRLALKRAQTGRQQVPDIENAGSLNLPSSDSRPAAQVALIHLPERLINSGYPKLAIYLCAFILALLGSTYARGTADITRADSHSLYVAAPYLWLGFILWLLGDISGQWPQIKQYWRSCDRGTRLLWSTRIVPAIMLIGSLLVLAQSMSAPDETAVNMALSAFAIAACGLIVWQLISFLYRRIYTRQGSTTRRHSTESRQLWITDRTPARPSVWKAISGRTILIALASALSIVVWANSGGNRIEPRIMLLWLASIATWALVFAPPRWNLFDLAAGTVDRIRGLTLRGRGWTIAALVLIMIVGAGFRFGRLHNAPSELISDMVVNIVDANRIYLGEDYPIFLGNNGGREPIQMYLLAFISGLPGFQFDRTTLVFVTALESLLTLPVMFWFAIEVIGKHRRRHALVVGLLATALLAVSFWHVSLARQGLRIPLSPLFTALSAVFFVRALRHNRRSDFILAGITLGLGLYSYKSVRMLPVVYVISIAVALLICRYSWRMRAKYLLNFAVLAFVAGAVFLPMLRYWIEEPDQFTGRATSRLFGDQPTTDEERWTLLREGGATFLGNIRNALLMFHYTHDNTWVSSIPGQPALDPVTGAFLVLGAAAWLGLLASERDPVYWFVPVLFFIMILLTALAIAFPIEVPSLQRASGAIPSAYLFAALPVARLCCQIRRALPHALGRGAAITFAVAVIAAAYQYNHDLYFGDFMDNYHRSAQNHSEAGEILQGFAESDGAYGNAFIIASPHWWDHRAVGVEAGAMRWDNSIVGVERLPQYLHNGLRRTDEYQLQAERDLLFFFAPRNVEAPRLLREWFPDGRPLEIRQEPLEKTFFIYRVPALGQNGLRAFLAANG